MQLHGRLCGSQRHVVNSHISLRAQEASGWPTPFGTVQYAPTTKEAMKGPLRRTPQLQHEADSKFRKRSRLVVWTFLWIWEFPKKEGYQKRPQCTLILVKRTS